MFVKIRLTQIWLRFDLFRSGRNGFPPLVTVFLSKTETVRDIKKLFITKVVELVIRKQKKFDF